MATSRWENPGFFFFFFEGRGPLPKLSGAECRFPPGHCLSEYCRARLSFSILFGSADVSGSWDTGRLLACARIVLLLPSYLSLCHSWLWISMIKTTVVQWRSNKSLFPLFFSPGFVPLNYHITCAEVASLCCVCQGQKPLLIGCVQKLLCLSPAVLFCRVPRVLPVLCSRLLWIYRFWLSGDLSMNRACLSPDSREWNGQPLNNSARWSSLMREVWAGLVIFIWVLASPLHSLSSWRS